MRHTLPIIALVATSCVSTEAFAECVQSSGLPRACWMANIPGQPVATIENCSRILGCEWTQLAGYDANCHDHPLPCGGGACACRVFTNQDSCEFQFGCDWSREPPTSPAGAGPTTPNNVNLGGLARKSFVESGRTMIDKGTVDLDTFYDRVLLDIHGLDDKIEVFINGTKVFTAGFNRVDIYEFTNLVVNGQNTFELRHTDNNNGRCWDFGYRLGDGSQWRYADHYANTSCVRPLRSARKQMYRIKFRFIFNP